MINPIIKSKFLSNQRDLVFFMIEPSLEVEGSEPPLEGEGTITNIYDTQDETVNRAIILEHAIH